MLKIYTFNILNPDINVSNLLFRNTQTGNFKEVIDNAKKIAEIDCIRYKLFRKKNILNIIDSWLNDGDSIVCLQEVPSDLLIDLKKKYKQNIRCNETVDKISFGSYSLNKSQKNIVTKYEYRVTIVSKNLKILKSSDIEMQNFNMRKNALYTNIIYNNNIIQCVNLHLHWKNTADDMDIFSKKIREYLGNEFFIICGDYNKTFVSKYMEPFINNIKIDNIDNLTNIGGKFTSFNTIEDKSNIILYKNIKNNPTTNVKGALIDYLIVGNSKTIKYTEQNILDSYKFCTSNSTDIKEYKLLYYLPRLADNSVIDIDNPDITKMATKWIDINNKSKLIDLSDHKPVMIEIYFINDKKAKSPKSKTKPPTSKTKPPTSKAKSHIVPKKTK